jgi:DNA-binding response OmpR family regulator
MKVLLAEDDLDVLDLLSYALRREGYTVVTATDGLQALARWESEQPDFILLDINLPKVGGMEVCQRIRRESATPLIMVTGRDAEADVLGGFHSGADDYLTKPFSAKELFARMRAVLRRSEGRGSAPPAREIRVGDIVLDLESHQAERRGRTVQLTPLEFRILHVLLMNAGRIVPSSRLLQYAWGYDGPDPSALKTHVSHIRQKLGLPRSGEGSIRAVSGVGYSLVADVGSGERTARFSEESSPRSAASC